MFRFPLEPVTLGGVTIPAGEPVLPVYFAGNRDSRHYTDPARFRVDRTDNPHLGFGHGAHFCLGAALARAELQIAFNALLSRFPDLALSARQSPADWQPGMARSLARLPVRLRGTA